MKVNGTRDALSLTGGGGGGGSGEFHKCFSLMKLCDFFQRNRLVAESIVEMEFKFFTPEEWWQRSDSRMSKESCTRRREQSSWKLESGCS